MVKITFVEHDGARTEVTAEAGSSLMKAATYGGVPGISADCGGNCACGTCRIYVPPAWRDRLPAAQPSEEEMIGFSQDAHDGVRLACQIRVTPEMDGLVLDLPNSQHYT
ncbi:MAG: 2Fe-2S iron-sulfur cluster binding domain-containing protein [Sphingomonadales bacterium]|nr:2Fe-2S iron-sulfur cluster binding domain-containing protein [Sphingomonadales bacterium]